MSQLRTVDGKYKVTLSHEGVVKTFKTTDSRGSVICSKIENADANYYDSKSKRYIYSKVFSAYNYDENGYKYDGIVCGRIEMLSNYNLTVTALCNEVPSKDAKLKVKTTNIPASYNDVNDVHYEYDKDGDIIDKDYGEFYGNSYIRVNNSANRDDLFDAYFVSGNTYTLDLPLWDENDNQMARVRKTDTLTWKIKVDKENGDTAGVATLKANAGSYTATLKALKPGLTTIEVSSKLTKKVIASYQIYVNAVGSANGTYYGDNEPHTRYEYDDDWM